MNSPRNGLESRRRSFTALFDKTSPTHEGSHAECAWPQLSRRLCLSLLLLTVTTPLFSQQPGTTRPPVYFVDGYHGGIYGHYPVEWKTRFIADQLAAHPEWRICLEIEPETWDTVQLRTPADYARFKSIAADKRVEFTNPTYAQPYCYNISGESLIRQFAYGMRKIHNHFPQVEFTTYAVEEPCFTSCLPQVLRLFGFKYASLKCPNTCWGGYTAPYGGELVNWTGSDGSSILTSPRYGCEKLQANSVWQTTAWGNETGYLDACIDNGIAHPVGMCFQDAGWKYGPWIGSGDSIRNNSNYVTWREYFEQISGGKTSDEYRMPQEDIRVSLMWGSQVLQRIARQVRCAENNLIMAEKTGVIANLTNGYAYEQATLDEAWRTTMLAQHHDSWIVPYNGLHKKGTWADHIRRWTAVTDELCKKIISEAYSSFRGEGVAREGLCLRVFNTLGTPRSEAVSVELPAEFSTGKLVVTDSRGKKAGHCTVVSGNVAKLLFKAHVPAFGYATYFIKQGRKAAHAASGKHNAPQQGEYILENDMYRIVVDPSQGGVITSLRAKSTGKREFANPRSEYAIGELRGYFYDEGRFRSSTETPAEVAFVVNNDLEQSLRISGRIASHPFTQTITIRKGERRIDFDLRIDWQHNAGIGAFAQKDAFNNNRRAFYDDRYNLSVLFPVGLRSPELFKDAPFDVCKSSLFDTHFTSWDSIKHNIILNWVDLSEQGDGCGMALLSDHTTSYSYGDGSPLGLTVQYSGNGLWGRNYGIDSPTHIRFALVPHRKAWDTAGISAESRKWNEPLRCVKLPQAAPEEASLLDLTGTGYEISAAYLDGDKIIIRLFNADGDNTPQTIRFTGRFTGIEEIDLRGERIASCDFQNKGNRTVTHIAMPRFGLKTLRLTK